LNNNKINIFPIVALTSILILISEILWFQSGGFYLMKGSGESYALYNSAVNVRDFESLILQDLATSPEEAAHPFFYIHHPNIPAKVISLILHNLGFILEWQVALMLIFSAIGLGFMASEVYEKSKWGGIIAILLACTSWESFHFNAGDLLRGPTNIILMLTIYLVLKNENLMSKKLNLGIGFLVSLGLMSDFGFAAFLISLVLFYLICSKNDQKKEWALKFCLLPAIVINLIYFGVVIQRVGIDFFLLDFKINYFGKVLGSKLLYQDIENIYQNARIVLWPSFSSKIQSFNYLISIIYNWFSLNSSLLKWGLICTAAYVIINSIIKLQLSLVWWIIFFITYVLNNFYGFNIIILLLPFILMVNKLNVLKDQTILVRLNFSIFLALIFTALIMPGYAIDFLYIGGRSPFPIYEIMTAALLPGIIGGLFKKNE
jgi:hypothetical protein